MAWDDLGPCELAELEVHRSIGEIIYIGGKRYKAVEDREKRSLMGDCRGCAFFIEGRVLCMAPPLTCGNFIWQEIKE